MEIFQVLSLKEQQLVTGDESENFSKSTMLVIYEYQ